MDKEFIILASALLAAFFGISLYMMNRVMKGLADIYLKKKQDFARDIKNSEILENHDDRGYTPLMVAFEKKWTNLIPEVLQRVLQLKNPLAVINHSNSTGESALRLAIELEDKDSLELLLAAGADVNKVHLPDNKTALMYAVSVLNLEFIEVLLTKGVRLDIKDVDEKTVLERFSTTHKKKIYKRVGVEYKIYKLLTKHEKIQNEQA